MSIEEKLAGEGTATQKIILLQDGNAHLRELLREAHGELIRLMDVCGSKRLMEDDWDVLRRLSEKIAKELG